MPPKTKQKKAGKGKTGKGKSSATAVDGLSTEDMSKDQMLEKFVRLEEELDREREKKRYFQLERDKIQAFWQISERQLEEAESTLRNKIKERAEAEEHHQVEITGYKQKMKHVLLEQQNAVSEMKMDTNSSNLMVKNQNLVSELDLLRGVQNLQGDFREKKLQGNSSIQQLQQKHQMELMELHIKYSSRLNEEELKFHRRTEALIEAEEKKWKSSACQLEEQMKTRTESLLQDQDGVLRQAEEFYSQIHRKQQVDLEVLKDELKVLQHQEAQKKKELEGAEKENEFLSVELQEAELKLSELQELQQEQVLLQDTLKKNIRQQKKEEKELREMTVQHELLLQAVQKVEQERDKLLQRQTKDTLDIQQRGGMKKLLLEKKIAAVTEALELKEAELCAALSVCSIDPEARSNANTKLQEILESKLVSVDALQTDLAERCKEYDQLLNSCKEQLQAAGGSLHDFPFKTSKQILKAATPK